MLVTDPKSRPTISVSLSVRSSLMALSATMSARRGSSDAILCRSALRLSRNRCPPIVRAVAAPTNRSPAYSGPSPGPSTKPMAAGGTENFQLNWGSS